MLRLKHSVSVYVLSVMKSLTNKQIIRELQDIATSKQEHMVCLTVDTGYRLIAKHTVFIGTLTGMMVHPREIFAVAVADRAAGIIIAHNHPSGDVEPSREDIETTQSLIAAGLILQIPVKDHFIVSGKKHLSFVAQGYINAVDLLEGSGDNARIRERVPETQKR